MGGVVQETAEEKKQRKAAKAAKKAAKEAASPRAAAAAAAEPEPEAEAEVTSPAHCIPRPRSFTVILAGILAGRAPGEAGQAGAGGGARRSRLCCQALGQ